MKKILITRPMPEAETYARELEEQGYIAAVAPMLVLKPITHNRPDFTSYDALIFTSVAGVRFFEFDEYVRDKDVFCVGSYTAEALAQKGYKNIHIVEGRAANLAKSIEQKMVSGSRFLHVRGVHVAYDMRDDFLSIGCILDSVVVYDSVKAVDMPAEIVRMIRFGEIDAIVFFSKRTAQTFIEICKNLALTGQLKSATALCISDAVKACVHSELSPECWRDTWVSARPDRQGVQALLEQL